MKLKLAKDSLKPGVWKQLIKKLKMNSKLKVSKRQGKLQKLQNTS